MIVNVDNLKKYQRFTQAFISNDNEFYKSLYFDFDSKLVYVFSETVHVRVPFDYEGEKIENTYIDGKMFFNVMKLSKEGLLFEDDKFKLNKDTYKVPLFRDDTDFRKDFDDFEDKWDIDFNVNFFNLLKKTKSILPLTDERKKNLHGVFIRDSKFIVSDKLRFVDVKLYKDCRDIDISNDLLRVLNICTGDETIEIFENEISYKVSIDSTIEFNIPKKITLALPDIRSEAFKELYQDVTFVEVEKPKLHEAMKMLEPFVMESSLPVVTFKLEEAGGITLIVDDPTKNIYATKQVDSMTISDDIKGQEFKIAYSFIKDLENLIRSNTYKIYFSEETKTLNVCDSDDEENHVVMMKIK